MHVDAINKEGNIGGYIEGKFYLVIENGSYVSGRVENPYSSGYPFGRSYSGYVNSISISWK